MWKSTLTIFGLVVLAIRASQAFQEPGGRVYDTEPLSIPANIVKYIGDHPEVLQDLGRHALNGSVRIVPAIDGDTLCSGCRSVFSFMKSLIVVGVKWESVRDDVVNVCKLLLDSNGYHGDVVCPGVIDNFGPLVYFATKTSRKSAKNICIHMNWCDPYKVLFSRTKRQTFLEEGIQHILDKVHFSNLQRKLNEENQHNDEQSKASPSADRQEDEKNGDEIDEITSSLFGVNKENLPMMSKMLAALKHDRTIGPESGIGEEFGDFIKSISSYDTWSKSRRAQMKNLESKADYLRKKLKTVMARIEHGGNVKPNARKMADLIAKSLLRQIREKRRSPVKRENCFKVVQLADIHIEVDYTTGAATDCGLPVCCRSDSQGKGSAGVWGNPGCNSSPTTIRKLMKSAASQNPDFVIFTGDNPPHTVWLETLDGQLNSSRWVARELAAAFPNTTIYPNMGNHENFPLNMYYVPREETKTLNREWGKMFKDIAKFGDDQLATINKAGYYTTLVKPGLRLIAYNSNYGGVGNFMNIINYNRPEYLEMLSWLRSTLAHARNSSEKVILTCHHEYGFSEIVVAFDEAILPIFAEYNDVIIFHTVGHVHRDEYRLNINPDTGDAVGVVFIAMSMTPYPDVNPGYRVWYFDPDTFKPIDYEQYNVDIRKSNADPNNENIVILSYRFSDEYGMPDLSVDSMMKLYYKLMANDTMLQRYWHLRRAGTMADGTCDVTCRRSQQCHIITPTFDLYRKCMRDQPDVVDAADDSRRHQIKVAVYGTNGALRAGGFLIALLCSCLWFTLERCI